MIHCLYGNIVNFSHTSQIHFLANNALLKTGLTAHIQTDRQTDTNTKVKTVYLLLGRYN